MPCHPPEAPLRKASLDPGSALWGGASQGLPPRAGRRVHPARQCPRTGNRTPPTHGVLSSKPTCSKRVPICPCSIVSRARQTHRTPRSGSCLSYPSYRPEAPPAHPRGRQTRPPSSPAHVAQYLASHPPDHGISYKAAVAASQIVFPSRLRISCTRSVPCCDATVGRRVSSSTSPSRKAPAFCGGNSLDHQGRFFQADLAAPSGSDITGGKSDSTP